MAKGKYGARAVNRLADLDESLLRDKCAEAERLSARVTELESRLNDERRERSAMVLARAHELSQELVSAARHDVAAEVAAHEQTRQRVAEWVVNWAREIGIQNPDARLYQFKPDGELGLQEFLHSLIGQRTGDHFATLLADHDAKFGTRRYRRATRKLFRESSTMREPGDKGALIALMKADAGRQLDVKDEVALESYMSPGDYIASLVQAEDAERAKGQDEQEA